MEDSMIIIIPCTGFGAYQVWPPCYGFVKTSGASKSKIIKVLLSK